jgi:secondary thiamine-phosphate synthase enzyme
MHFFKQNLTVNTDGRGLYELTNQINQHIRTWGVGEGMAYLFIQHCSASLVINECYDDTARRDLEAYLERIAPEGEKWHEHTIEGSDDSPAHMRALITPTNLSIPIDNGQLSLGTWQGIYLAEHRRRSHQRQLLLRVLAVE